MRKIVLIISLIALLLLISSCAKQGESTTSNLNPFIGGSVGLQIDFEEDSPPDEVTDDSSFTFNAIVRIENKGEAKINRDDLRVDLEGFLPSDFQTTESALMNKKPNEDLLPTRRDTDGNQIDGTTVFITIPDDNSAPLTPVKFSGNVEFPFKAHVCYAYETIANARICVLKDLLSENDNQLCDPNGAKDIDSSGSPVQFGNFRQSAIGKDKISFTFEVNHVGNGQVFKHGDGIGRAVCPRETRDRRVQEEQLRVSVVTEGLSGLNCNFPGGTNDGFVRLIRGKRTITCTLDLTNQHNSDFEKIVDIKAEFNYEDSKETNVLVKHLIDE